MNMNKNGKTLAVLWLSGLVLAGMGTYAATNTDVVNELSNGFRPHMVREIWSGDFENPHLAFTSLSDEEQSALESLLSEFKEEELKYFESLRDASDDEKTALESAWETTKASYKEQALAIVSDESADVIEKIFSRENKGGREMKQKMGGEIWDRFLGNFFDEESLTDTQKEEIKALQEEKEEKIKAINEEFFANIKQYIPEDKQEQFEQYISEKEDKGFMKGQERFSNENRWKLGFNKEGKGENTWELPEMDGQSAPELDGERPELPEMNGELPEMNGERPELPEGDFQGGPRMGGNTEAWLGEMNGNMPERPMQGGIQWGMGPQRN